MKYPEIVYKYRDWENPLHRSVLIHNELYFSSPKDFNDPFDCRITKNFKLLDNEEKRKSYVDRVMINNYEYWRQGNIDPQKSMKEFEERLLDIEKVQFEFEQLTFASQDKHYGVHCFSTVWNNILMWSHYSKNHQGVCIGFYEEELKKLPSMMVKGGLVIYDPNYPDIDPLEEDEVKELVYTTHYKSKFWEYESEYRMSKIFFPDIPTNTDRIVNFPENCIAEVILGLNISAANQREVIAICKAKNIPVYKASKIPQKFSITCSPV